MSPADPSTSNQAAASQPALRSSNGSNPWFAVSIGLIGLIVGYGIGSTMNEGSPIFPGTNPVAQAPDAPAIPDTPPPPANPPSVDDDPVLGESDAAVTVIEFTDYQCPFCGRHFTDTHGQIKKEYIDTGKVKLVLRDFPLSFHPHAQKASEATECADDQGKFWEMHDKIFETQQAWSAATDAVPAFKQYAADLKLNAAAFNDCLDSGKYKDEVQKDLADGSASGINGTPGFWVLGPDGKAEQIRGAVPFAEFKRVIDGMTSP